MLKVTPQGWALELSGQEAASGRAHSINGDLPSVGQAKAGGCHLCWGDPGPGRGPYLSAGQVVGVGRHPGKDLTEDDAVGKDVSLGGQKTKAVREAPPIWRAGQRPRPAPSSFAGPATTPLAAEGAPEGWPEQLSSHPLTQMVRPTSGPQHPRKSPCPYLLIVQLPTQNLGGHPVRGAHHGQGLLFATLAGGGREM